MVWIFFSEVLLAFMFSFEIDESIFANIHILEYISYACVIHIRMGEYVRIGVVTRVDTDQPGDRHHLSQMAEQLTLVLLGGKILAKAHLEIVDSKIAFVVGIHTLPRRHTYCPAQTQIVG